MGEDGLPCERRRAAIPSMEGACHCEGRGAGRPPGDRVNTRDHPKIRWPSGSSELTSDFYAAKFTCRSSVCSYAREPSGRAVLVTRGISEIMRVTLYGQFHLICSTSSE